MINFRSVKIQTSELYLCKNESKKMEKALAFGEKNYNYYSAFLRNKYNGQKVYKVIVDAGFTCPNRDGSKGYGGWSFFYT